MLPLSSPSPSFPGLPAIHHLRTPPQTPPSTSSTLSTLSSPTGASAIDENDEVHFLTDDDLARAFLFVKEVGCGNWGSVWLGRTKRLNDTVGEKVAIKLVHRTRTPTTAARVRALWNEFASLKDLKESHPSVISFESFFLTPSYTLIVMPFLERSLPVRIPETQAKPIFRSLISAVAFLHRNDITHNDIKPANILLSSAGVPVIVDFGFATRWDPFEDEDPFISTNFFGTQEYLSPTRARGYSHDERASDVWSLGVTLFEILMGRTPFELGAESKEFMTDEEMEDYYEFTTQGRWIGSWEMSNDVEDLLRRMIHPNQVLRIRAVKALEHVSLEDEEADSRTSSAPSYVKYSERIARHRTGDDGDPVALRQRYRTPPRSASTTSKPRKHRSRGDLRSAQSQGSLKPRLRPSLDQLFVPAMPPLRRVTSRIASPTTTSASPAVLTHSRGQPSIEDPSLLADDEATPPRRAPTPKLKEQRTIIGQQQPTFRVNTTADFRKMPSIRVEDGVTPRTQQQARDNSALAPAVDLLVPSINIARLAVSDAGSDARRDHISHWVRNIDMNTFETELKASSPAQSAISASSSLLFPRTPSPGPDQALLSPIYTTPNRPNYLRYGRPRADVPESVGAPSPSPNSPVITVTDEAFDSVFPSNIKRKRSGLITLFQASIADGPDEDDHDRPPSPPTQRVSFLKFPPHNYYPPATPPSVPSTPVRSRSNTTLGLAPPPSAFSISPSPKKRATPKLLRLHKSFMNLRSSPASPPPPTDAPAGRTTRPSLKSFFDTRFDDRLDSPTISASSTVELFLSLKQPPIPTPTPPTTTTTTSSFGRSFSRVASRSRLRSLFTRKHEAAEPPRPATPGAMSLCDVAQRTNVVETPTSSSFSSARQRTTSAGGFFAQLGSLGRGGAGNGRWKKEERVYS